MQAQQTPTYFFETLKLRLLKNLQIYQTDGIFHAQPHTEVQPVSTSWLLGGSEELALDDE